MLNSIMAFVVMAVYLGILALGFRYGVLTSRESVLTGAVVALGFYALRDQGRISDLEKKVGIK